MYQIEPLHRETVCAWLADHLGPPTSEVGQSHFWLVRGPDGYARVTIRWDGLEGGLQAWDTRSYRGLPFDNLPGLEAIIRRCAAAPSVNQEHGTPERSSLPPQGWRGAIAWLVGKARRSRGGRHHCGSP